MASKEIMQIRKARIISIIDERFNKTQEKTSMSILADALHNSGELLSQQTIFNTVQGMAKDYMLINNHGILFTPHILSELSRNALKLSYKFATVSEFVNIVSAAFQGKINNSDSIDELQNVCKLISHSFDIDSLFVYAAAIKFLYNETPDDKNSVILMVNVISKFFCTYHIAPTILVLDKFITVPDGINFISGTIFLNGDKFKVFDAEIMKEVNMLDKSSFNPASCSVYASPKFVFDENDSNMYSVFERDCVKAYAKKFYADVIAAHFADNSALTFDEMESEYKQWGIKVPEFVNLDRILIALTSLLYIVFDGKVYIPVYVKNTRGYIPTDEDIELALRIFKTTSDKENGMVTSAGFFKMLAALFNFDERYKIRPLIIEVVTEEMIKRKGDYWILSDRAVSESGFSEKETDKNVPVSAEDFYISTIEDYFASTGTAPSMSNLVSILNDDAETIEFVTNKLIQKGIIKKIGGRFYSEKTNPGPILASLPVYGLIACGESENYVQENTGENVNVVIDGNNSDKYYVLRASGDSMTGKMIFDGDYVLIEKTESANIGDIVVALDEDNKVTLKTLKRDNSGNLYLHPENPDYPDMKKNRIRIQGRAVQVFRSLKH